MLLIRVLQVRLLLVRVLQVRVLQARVLQVLVLQVLVLQYALKRQSHAHHMAVILSGIHPRNHFVPDNLTHAIYTIVK